MPHPEIGLGAQLRKSIPRTHDLTVVAAIDTVADERSQRFRYRATQFDRQIRDAAPGIDPVGGDDGPRRTGVDARGALTAVVADRRIRGQRQIGQDLAEEEARTGIAIEQQGVLASPAQPRALTDRDLHQRRRVDDDAPLVRLIFRDAQGEPLEALAQHLVIVATEGISRHESQRGLGEHLVRRPGRGEVVHACGDDAAATGHQQVGPAAEAAVTRHIIHLAVTTGRQPGLEVTLGAGQAGIADAHRGKAQFGRPAANVRDQHRQHAGTFR